MPSYKPVDFDPFAPAAPSRDVRLKPVDFDPFAKTKPKKKKEDESFLSGFIPTLKSAAGRSLSEIGMLVDQFSRTGFISSASLLGGVNPTPGDNILTRPVKQAATATQNLGRDIRTKAEAELPASSIADRLRQQAEIKNAKPGTGSEILAGLGRAASRYTDLYYPQLSGVTRDVLPQTAEQAAPVLAKVQAPFGTARGASEFVASQIPSLLPVFGGKAVQIGARALPRLGVNVSEAALAQGINRGVVATGTAMNAASAGNQAYEDVLAAGGTQEEADRAFKIAAAGAAAVSGAATKIPGIEQLAFAEKPAKGGILRSAGRAVIGEAPQEFVEEGGAALATNVGKLGTAAEGPIGEDVLSSGILGGIGGGIIAAPIGGLQGVFSGRDTGPTAPTSGAAQAPRTPPPPPPPPADMEALAKALGPVGGKVILQEPTGPQEYTFQGFDEDGGVVLADADGVVFSEDPDQIQAAIKAGVAEPESGLGGMAFGMDITEGLDDVFAPPPPPPPPPPPFTEKPKFTIETAEEEATRKAEQAVRDARRMEAAAREPTAEPSPFSPGTDKPKFTIEMPPPSPMNAQGKSQVGKIVFDQEKGVGQVPLNQNVKYRGFTAMMRPSKFLELAADLEKPKQSSLDYIRQSVEEGKGVGSPFLNLDFETGKVKSHDGRHRMMVIQEKNGDVPVPVHIFGKGEQRARSLDEGKINSFASSMTGEDGRQSTDNFSEAFLDEAAVPVSAPAPVQEPVAEEPELPPPPPERVRTVTTPGGSKVNTAFEVVDAANLTAATGDLQNRDRSRSSTDLQVQDIFAKFDPERLGESLESDRGSPIVGPDNVVESGNGRVLAINKVYDESPEKADAYRKFIEDQGFDISGLDRPVLVRRRIDRMTPDERSKFVRESNMDTKLQLSTSEKAQTDAASLTPDVMSLMASPDVNASTNQGFVRAFLSKLPTQEQAAFLDKDGRLSAEGTRRLRTAVKSSAYGDADLINTLDESQDNNIKSIGGALEDAAPAWRRMLDAIKEGDVEPEMDTTKQLVEAAKIVRDVRNKGMKIGDFLSQQDAFNPLNPVTERFIRSFYNETLGRAAGREAIADVLEKYARRASEQTTSEGLFESESMSPVEILDGILDERGSGAGQSNMFASIQPISPRRREEILDEGGKIPSLSRGITKLKKLWADGKIDAKEFAYEVASYSDFIEDAKNWKRWEDIGKPKVRGPDRIREELLKQKRLGRLSVEEVNFAEWFIQRNENLLGDLGIAVKKPSEKIRSSGFYDVLPRVMYLIKDRADDGTTVHEIMHHLERMMPQDIRMAIKRAWAKDLDRVERLPYDGKNDKDVMFFKAIRAFHDQKKVNLNGEDLSPSEAFKFATNLISDGDVDGRLYQYVNPSEFWAVNATEILQGRYDVQGSLLGRLKNWLRELSIKIKGLFKLDSNAPIIKALDSLAKSDGKFVSNQMLEEKPGDFSDIASLDEKRTEKDFKELKALVDDLAKAMEQESFGIPQMQRRIVSALDEALNSLEDIYDNAPPEFDRKIESLERKIQNLKAIAGASLKPANENKLETEVEKAERELTLANKAFNNLFYNDERSFKDRRTKERKAYEKELDQLEAAKDEAFVKWDKLYREQTDAMMMALTNGTAAQMRNAVAKAQERTDKIIDEGADLQKENRGCD